MPCPTPPATTGRSPDAPFSGPSPRSPFPFRTTIRRPHGFKSAETGGLSGGAYLNNLSNKVINYIHRSTSGKLPIIGVGGIDSVESAGEKLNAGASMVQLYTGWVYRGPFFAKVLANGLKSHGETWI